MIAAGAAATGLAWGPTAAGAAASPRSTTSGWVSTHTQALGPILVQATALGALPPATPVHLALGLAVRNPAGLKTFTAEVTTPDTPEYGHWLTPAEFTSRYSPTTAQVGAVTEYLRSKGFTGISVASNRLYVTATGSAAQAEAAFNTPIEQYRQFGHTIYANTAAAQVPASLGGTVLAVLGLNDIVAMHHQPLVDHKATAATSDACPPTTYPLCPGYQPKDFWQAYDVGNTPTGHNSTIAIMAEGDLSGVVKDLRIAEKQFGLPQVPYSIVHVGTPSPDTSGADEWDLDTQYSTGMAGYVKHLYIYDTTSLTDSDIGVEFNKWASQDIAEAGSASFGECEAFPYADGLMLTNDEAMNEAAVQGQTMHASTGDTGGQDCAVAPTNGAPESGAPDVEYPSSSPYIVAVGGTTLLTNSDGSYDQELAWYAGGGGNSEYEYSPYWQSCVATLSALGQVGYGRGIPDIAMDADAQSGATVIVNGKPLIVGGTSLSSPLALGVWARLLTARGKVLGFAAPRLYALYPKSSTCTSGAGTPPTTPLSTPPYPFHDVYVGSNGAYVATPGWDFTTGLGSYDVSQMAATICQDKDHDCDYPPNKDDK